MFPPLLAGFITIWSGIALKPCYGHLIINWALPTHLQSFPGFRKSKEKKELIYFNPGNTFAVFCVESPLLANSWPPSLPPPKQNQNQKNEMCRHQKTSSYHAMDLNFKVTVGSESLRRGLRNMLPASHFPSCTTQPFLRCVFDIWFHLMCVCSSVMCQFIKTGSSPLKKRPTKNK